ncbi:calcium signal-modulating cyclophilin ligand [Pseudoliparis swirei]|uniref:calcium signal-modulating cyclophilin ligand n=1 Tax=Pseudoliparis swirei TaxID=2059687 RepID=UPI0024BE0914|nr:calcium signal-modulating cyclophilin ligand [Pseudoliparis swirei]
MEAGEAAEGEKTGSLSVAQRRAEIRRRKLLMNSEDRMNRIVGFTKQETDNNAAALLRASEPRFHLDLDRAEPRSSSSPPPFLSEASAPGGRSRGSTPERTGSPEPDSGGEPLGVGEIRQRPRGERAPGDDGHGDGSPRRGLQKYLSRFDDAMKLRGQLADEKPSPDGAAPEPDEFDPFRLFRLVGSVLLAVFARGFVCTFLSIFAPFLTLELAYMGLSKYFPTVEKKAQTTVLTTALLLSGIPGEVINRSMDTYRRMGDVFADLCVYFFTFILSHEILLLVGSETPPTDPGGSP